MWTKIDDKCQKAQFFVYFGLFLWLLQMMARKLSRTRFLHFIFTIKSFCEESNRIKETQVLPR